MRERDPEAEGKRLTWLAVLRGPGPGLGAQESWLLLIIGEALFLVGFPALAQILPPSFMIL